MFKLSDDIPEDRMAAAQEHLRQDINRTRIEEGKKHPPYKEPKTIEEWWAVVDDFWKEVGGK